MNTKEIKKWSIGVEKYENGHLKSALRIFLNLPNNSKINFNIGMVYCKIGYFYSANDAFNQALSQDPYFAAAYFEQGYVLLLLKSYALAKKSFHRCLELLLDNEWIDYHQLGLSYRLCRCEILFNLAICTKQLGSVKEAARLFSDARLMSLTPDQHTVIVIEHYQNGKSFPFYIDPSALFKIPRTKLDNLPKKYFLKEATVVFDAGMTCEHGFVGFAGAVILNPILDWEDGVTTLVRNKAAVPRAVEPRKSFTLPLSKSIKASASMFFSKNLSRFESVKADREQSYWPVSKPSNNLL